jgi:hypothetical protein
VVANEERAALLSAEIPMEPAKIVTYFNNLRTRENTAARKRIKALHTAAAVRDQQCGQLWTHIPEFLLAQVMDQLSEGARQGYNLSVPFGLSAHGWRPEVSAVTRGVCKSWQRMHDGLIPTMRVNNLRRTTCTVPNEPNGWRKFTGLKALQLHTYAVTSEQVEALASLTSLTILSLEHWSESVELAAKSLSALAPLTALSTLQLNNQTRAYMSGRCLRGLAPLNALTSLNLGDSILGDDPLRALLPPLTSLTGLHLFRCTGIVTAEGLEALCLACEVMRFRRRQNSCCFLQVRHVPSEVYRRFQARGLTN